MPYTDLYQKQEGFRIPSVLAVAIVAGFSFFVANFFVSAPRNTQAVKKNIIQVETTNIGSGKANIIWRTSEKEIGSVIVGESQDKLSSFIIDERDSSKLRQPYFNHSVNLANLKPNTNYFYSITNGKELLSINEKTVFSFRTAALDNRINSLKPAYGTVISTSGLPESNVLVTITTAGGVPLSTVSKSSGEWLIPLNGLIDATSHTLLNPSADELLNITFFDEKGSSSTVKAPIKLSSPVSVAVKMGSSYSLPEDAEVLGTTTQSQSSSRKLGTAVTGQFSLAYPQPNTLLSVGNPLIKGTAVPSSIISITVQAITGTTAAVSKLTTTDSQGNWKATLAKSLPAGAYKLSAKVNGTSSNIITRQFTVTKSGERVLAEATGSAQLTSAPTPTTTATSVSPKTTSAPTVALEPTDITPTLPSTGGSVTYLVYSSAALILLGLGLLVVF